MDKLIEMFNQFADSAGFMFFVALISAMIIVQGVKAPIKTFWPITWNQKYRSWTIFILAYGVGYWAGNKFLAGKDVHQLSIFIGLINPLIYFTLVQYAVIKEKILLLSVLKMRSVDRDGDGKISLHETQQFWSGDR